MPSLILLFILHNAFAAKTKLNCTNLFFDKARIQKILSEEHGFSADVLEQAAYVEAELEVFNKRGRQPIVFVHAPGEKLRTFKPTAEGGEFYGGSRYTHFIFLNQIRFAILEPEGWKILLQELKQRDPGLKAFFKKHRAEFEALSARWGYDANRMENAYVYEGDGFSLMQIYGSPFGRTERHFWFIRDGEPFRHVEHLFAGEDGESAFALRDDLFIFRIRNGEDGRFQYKIVTSIAKGMDKVKNQKLADLIRAYPAQLTRLIFEQSEEYVNAVLGARVAPGRFVGEASRETGPVFLLENGDRRFTNGLLVLDPSLGVGGQKNAFARVRHLELDDGRSLNVVRRHGQWQFQDVTGRGRAKELDRILNQPLGHDFFERTKAKLL